MMQRLKNWAGTAMEGLRIYGPATRDKVTILAFHRISDEERPGGLDYGVEAFDRFCAFLARNVQVVSLSEQIARLREGRSASGTVSITFDDGYLDNFTAAAPILERHGLPATFFVATSFIGSTTVPWWDKELATPPPWMSWEQLASLVARGFEISCHTQTHADLGRVSLSEARAELEGARRELQRRLGMDSRLFAYPYGGAQNITEETRELVRELGFSCCLSCHGGVNSRDADPFRLYRVPINGWYSTPQQFGCEWVLNRLTPQ